MMGIDGHVLVRVQKVKYHQHTAAAPARRGRRCHLARMGQNMPINHLHHHHFLSTHHVAAPPRLLGLFLRRRPSTIRSLAGPAPNAELPDLDLCVADRAGRSADGSIEVGKHRFERRIKAACRLHLRGLLDDDVKRHVTAGANPMVLCPCLQHLAQQLALGVVGANISPSCRADPPCQATPAPTEQRPTRLRTTPAAATPRGGQPRSRPGRSSDMPRYICRGHRGWI